MTGKPNVLSGQMDKDVQGFSIAFLMIFVSNHNTIVSQETHEILSPLSLHYICDLLFLSLTVLTMPLIAGNYSEEISKNLQLLKRQL